MPEYRVLSKEEREILQEDISSGGLRAAALYKDDDIEDVLRYGVMWLRSYEATVAALEAQLAEAKDDAINGRTIKGMARIEGGLSLETPHRLRPTWRLQAVRFGHAAPVLVAEAETLDALFAKIEAEEAALREAKGGDNAV
jgi:hypothetical protein